MSRRIVTAPIQHGYHVSYKKGWWIFATSYHAGVFNTVDEASAKIRELIDTKESRDFKLELL